MAGEPGNTTRRDRRVGTGEKGQQHLQRHNEAMTQTTGWQATLILFIPRNSEQAKARTRGKRARSRPRHSTWRQKDKPATAGGRRTLNHYDATKTSKHIKAKKAVVTMLEASSEVLVQHGATWFRWSFANVKPVVESDRKIQVIDIEW